MPFNLQDLADAAVLLGPNDEILAVNSALERLTGWSEGDLIGKLWQDLQVDAAGHAKAPPVLPSSKRLHLYRGRNGSGFWGDTVSLPFRGPEGALRGGIRILCEVSAPIRRAQGVRALIGFIADRGFCPENHLPALLDLGCRCLGLELGVLCRAGEEGDHVLAAGGSFAWVMPGQTLLGHRRPSSISAQKDRATMIDHAGRSPFRCHTFYQETGFETVLAADLSLGDREHGTLCFVDRRSRGRPFDDEDRHILQFLANWLEAGERARAEKSDHETTFRRLVASEERYRQLYEKTPAMLHSVDDRGRIVTVSDAWLSAFGYDREEVLGVPSTTFFTERSRCHAVGTVLPTFKAIGRCDDVAYQIVTKDGQVRDVLLSAIAEYADDGSFLSSLSVLMDVTERKRVEQALLDKTSALERTNADLARFAHIASHDLQEPLRQMIACSEILKKDFSAELSDEAAEITKIIQSGGHRLRLMINDLLTYMRVSEQLNQTFEPVDMSAVLGHALDDLAAEVRSKEARIRAACLPLVWGRIPLFKLVFQHLLANALRHGGRRQLAIEVSVADGGDSWKFAVADQGIGVEQRFANRIFEIFQRLHFKDEREGSGAGLAICKLIIQRCGGNIWLDPSYDDGARFVFTLPKDRPAEPVLLKPSPSFEDTLCRKSQKIPESRERRDPLRLPQSGELRKN